MRAAHIAAVAKEAEAANSKEQLSLAPSKRSGHSNSIEATLVPAVGLAAFGESACQRQPFIAAVETSLREQLGLLKGRCGEPRNRAMGTQSFSLGDHNALRFEISPHGGLAQSPVRSDDLRARDHNLKYRVPFDLCCSLDHLAAVLDCCSCSPVRPGRLGDETELSVDGPREIEQAAQALNDMRSGCVRSLVNERTANAGCDQPRPSHTAYPIAPARREVERRTAARRDAAGHRDDQRDAGGNARLCPPGHSRGGGLR